MRAKKGDRSTAKNLSYRNRDLSEQADRRARVVVAGPRRCFLRYDTDPGLVAAIPVAVALPANAAGASPGFALSL